MTNVRVAGFVRPRESLEMERIASVMQVTSWIQRVSADTTTA